MYFVSLSTLVLGLSLLLPSSILAKPLPFPQNYTPSPAPAPIASAPHRTQQERDWSEIWAGAVIGDTAGITSISATVTLPKITLPPNGNPKSRYEGGLWVGIDGWGECEQLLQVIILWTLENNRVTYTAAHEWAPTEPSMERMDLELKQGDRVTLEVIAASSAGSTGGATRVWNHRTGESARFVYKGMPGLMCQQFADVVVETLTANLGQSNEYQIAMPAFSPVMFENVTYTRVGGGKGAIGSDLTVLDQWRNGRAATRTTVLDKGTLQVTYEA